MKEAGREGCRARQSATVNGSASSPVSTLCRLDTPPPTATMVTCSPHLDDQLATRYPLRPTQPRRWQGSPDGHWTDARPRPFSPGCGGRDRAESGCWGGCCWGIDGVVVQRSASEWSVRPFSRGAPVSSSKPQRLEARPPPATPQPSGFPPAPRLREWIPIVTVGGRASRTWQFARDCARGRSRINPVRLVITIPIPLPGQNKPGAVSAVCGSISPSPINLSSHSFGPVPRLF